MGEAVPKAKVEPWLRGTHTEVDALRRQVLHGLELAAEDRLRWCSGLGEAELKARPFGLPSVGFQMRHMVRSLDRLLSYAEGRALTEAQLEALGSEHEAAPGEALAEEFEAGLRGAGGRVRAFDPTEYEAARYVGRDRLRTTLGGLLVHCVEHTQRHAGQMVTTAKLMAALRGGGDEAAGS